MNKKQFLTITLLLSSVIVVRAVDPDLSQAPAIVKVDAKSEQEKENKDQEAQQQQEEALEAKRKQEEQAAKDKAEKTRRDAEEAVQNTARARREKAQAEEKKRKAAFVQTAKELDTVLPESTQDTLLQSAQQREAAHDQQAEELYVKLADLTPDQPILSQTDFEVRVSGVLRELQKQLTTIADQQTRQAVLTRVIAKVQKAHFNAVSAISQLGSRAVTDTKGKEKFSHLVAAESTLDTLAQRLLAQQDTLVADYQPGVGELVTSPALLIQTYPKASAFVIGAGAVTVGAVAAVLVDRQYFIGKGLEALKTAFIGHAGQDLQQKAADALKTEATEILAGAANFTKK